VDEQRDQKPKAALIIATVTGLQRREDERPVEPFAALTAPQQELQQIRFV